MYRTIAATAVFLFIMSLGHGCQGPATGCLMPGDVTLYESTHEVMSAIYLCGAFALAALMSIAKKVDNLEKTETSEK